MRASIREGLLRMAVRGIVAYYPGSPLPQPILEFDPEHCLLALNEDDVIGAIFGYCYPWQDRINYYMQELFVDPDQRRSGHGRRLVRHLLDKLGESDVSISLIANEATPAAAFYEEFGLRQHRYYKFYCGTVKTNVE